MTKKPYYLSNREKADAFDLIRKHCHQNDDGTGTYDQDWSDVRIANLVSVNANAGHISKIRVDLVGKLHAIVRTGGSYDGKRLQELEDRIVILENLTAELLSQLT